MIDVHLSLELLEAVAEGRLSRTMLHRFALEHALAVSPRAALEAEAWRLEEERKKVAARLVPGGYEPAWEALRFRCRNLHETLHRQQVLAERDFAELAGLPVDQRATRIRSSDVRFRSYALVERLLQAARESLEDSPEDALEWAHASFSAALQAEVEPGLSRSLRSELRWRSLAIQAAALYRLGKSEAADELLVAVRYQLDEHPSADPLVRAEFDALEAGWLWRAGHHQVAVRKLERAVSILSVHGTELETHQARRQLETWLTHNPSSSPTAR